MVMLLSKRFALDSTKSNLLGTKIDYLYPLLGLIALGNLLIIINTFFFLLKVSLYSQFFVLLTIPSLKGLM